jgi:signal transduction histidine kinase
MRTARLRLTLLYSGMSLALGTVLILVIYLLATRGEPLRFGSTHTAAHAVPRALGIPAPPRVSDVVNQQRSADLSHLLAISWLVLAVTALASAVLGWFVAGRVLRPLREMTTTARTITAGNLSERLALRGPNDEFKQLGDTLDDLLARLEASFETQRRFVANASHELRTPLTVERTLLQVALADPDASAPALRATCEELLITGEEQERLLEALLTLASSERGLDHREPLDVGAIADGVVLTNRSEIERRGLRLQTRSDPARSDGDPALIERLVANLLGNAIEYNRPGGLIEIRTSSEQGRPVLIVSNTGPHVARQDLELLFEPFQRLDGTRASHPNGHHGLGLSIVRAIAAAHDATVNVDPNSGGGLTVRVSFPPCIG